MNLTYSNTPESKLKLFAKTFHAIKSPDNTQKKAKKVLTQKLWRPLTLRQRTYLKKAKLARNFYANKKSQRNITSLRVLDHWIKKRSEHKRTGLQQEHLKLSRRLYKKTVRRVKKAGQGESSKDHDQIWDSLRLHYGNKKSKKRTNKSKSKPKLQVKKRVLQRAKRLTGIKKSKVVKLPSDKNKKLPYYKARALALPILKKLRLANLVIKSTFNPLSSRKKWFQRYTFAPEAAMLRHQPRTLLSLKTLNRFRISSSKPKLFTPDKKILPSFGLPTSGQRTDGYKEIRKTAKEITKVRNAAKSKIVKVKVKRRRRKRRRRAAEKKLLAKKVIASKLAITTYTKKIAQLKSRTLYPPHKEAEDKPSKEIRSSLLASNLPKLKALYLNKVIRKKVRALAAHSLKTLRSRPSGELAVSPFASRHSRRKTSKRLRKIRIRPTASYLRSRSMLKPHTRLRRAKLKSSPHLSLWPRARKVRRPERYYLPRRKRIVKYKWFNKNKRRAQKRDSKKYKFRKLRTSKTMKSRRIRPILLTKGAKPLLLSSSPAKAKRLKQWVRKNPAFTRTLYPGRVDTFTSFAKKYEITVKNMTLSFSTVLPLVNTNLLETSKTLTSIAPQTLNSSLDLATSTQLMSQVRTISFYSRLLLQQSSGSTHFSLNPDSRHTRSSSEMMFFQQLSYLTSAKQSTTVATSLRSTPVNPRGGLTTAHEHDVKASKVTRKQIRVLISNWVSDQRALRDNSNHRGAEKIYSMVFIGQRTKDRFSNINTDFGPLNLYFQESWTLESKSLFNNQALASNSLTQSLKSLLRKRIQRSRFNPEGQVSPQTNPATFYTFTKKTNSFLNINSSRVQKIVDLYKSKVTKNHRASQKAKAILFPTYFFTKLRKQMFRKIRARPNLNKKHRIVPTRPRSRTFRGGKLSKLKSDKGMKPPKNATKIEIYYSRGARIFRVQKHFIRLSRRWTRRKVSFARKKLPSKKVANWELRAVRRGVVKRKRKLVKRINFLRSLRNKVKRTTFRPNPNLAAYYHTGPLEGSERRLKVTTKSIFSLARSEDSAKPLLVPAVKLTSNGTLFPTSPYLTMTSAAALSILSSPLLLKLQHAQSLKKSSHIKINELLNSNFSLFSLPKKHLQNKNIYVPLNQTNLSPHPCFNYTISKKLVSFLSQQSFRHNALPILYNTLIRFMEHVTGTKCAVQLYPYVSQHVSQEAATRYQIWIPRMSFYERKLGHRFFLEEALHIMHLSFVLRDASIVAYWLRSMILRISFWKTRSIFRFLRYLLLNYYQFVFKELQIKGMKIKLKGKISAAGNSRKRTILFRTGRTSHSSVNARVSYKSLLVNTFTGVMGFQLWLFY